MASVLKNGTWHSVWVQLMNYTGVMCQCRTWNFKGIVTASVTVSVSDTGYWGSPNALQHQGTKKSRCQTNFCSFDMPFYRTEHQQEPPPPHQPPPPLQHHDGSSLTEWNVNLIKVVATLMTEWLTLTLVTVTLALQALLSSTFLQTLPDLVTPLKGHSLSPCSCPPKEGCRKPVFGVWLFERHCDSSISGLLWVWLSLTLTWAPIEARVQRYLWLNLKQQLTVTPLPMFIISVWFACSILSIIIQSMVVVGLPLGQSGLSFRSILRPEKNAVHEF